MAYASKILFNGKFTYQGLAGAKAALAGIKDGVPTAASAAINRTLSRTKTHVGTELPKELNIKRANLTRRMFITRATARTLEGYLKIRGRPIGLINFGAVDTRKTGVYARIWKDGPLERFPNAFIGRGMYGTSKGSRANVHVFARTTDARTPIKAQNSQRLYDLFLQSKTGGNLEAFIVVELQTELDGQVRRILFQHLPLFHGTS